MSQFKTKSVNPEAYIPLLNTIAKGESNGNYNAYFGNAGNSTIVFTNMPISDVIKWQENFIIQGNPSNAVGKYQFIEPTLKDLVRTLSIEKHSKFDAKLQDRLAIALIERRGVLDFVNNKISRQEFAHNLSKEWAALPKAIGPNPEQSYYAGDGLNKVQVTIDEVYASLGSLEG